MWSFAVGRARGSERREGKRHVLRPAFRRGTEPRRRLRPSQWRRQDAATTAGLAEGASHGRYAIILSLFIIFDSSLLLIIFY